MTATSGNPIQVGETIGRLTVMEVEYRPRPDGRRNAWAICSCSCGTQPHATPGSQLRAGKVRSCGCLQREVNAARLTTHGASRTRLYNIWEHMLGRCRSPKSRGYRWYGGRGVVVVDEWSDFATFQAWALGSGYTDKLTIDRIDNDGNYEPGNCRWVTQAQQALNTSTNRQLEAFGETKTVAEWSRDPRTVCGAATFKSRISQGWTAERAVTTPVRYTGRWHSTAVAHRAGGR